MSYDNGILRIITGRQQALLVASS